MKSEIDEFSPRPWIVDEISPLRTVVLGTAVDRGQLQINNPTVASHRRKGTLPKSKTLTRQSEGLRRVLETHGVKVLVPANVTRVLQTFVRDLGFVVGDIFVWSNLKRRNRTREFKGLRPVIDQLSGIKTISVANDIFVEGGDIVLLKGRLLIGIGKDPERSRTSVEAIDFFRRQFPDREVIPIITTATDDPTADPTKHPLHLDCTFQPVGANHAIFFEGGFARRPDAIFDLLGEQNLIRISGREMFRLWPNIFSLAPDKVVSAPSFIRLNDILRRLGISVVEVPYEEVGKLGGLFRCSTLPLRRRF